MEAWYVSLRSLSPRRSQGNILKAFLGHLTWGSLLLELTVTPICVTWGVQSCELQGARPGRMNGYMPRFYINTGRSYICIRQGNIAIHHQEKAGALKEFLFWQGLQREKFRNQELQAKREQPKSLRKGQSSSQQMPQYLRRFFHGRNPSLLLESTLITQVKSKQRVLKGDLFWTFFFF